MLLRDILRKKGNRVLSIDPTASLADVVQEMNRHNCGSLIVCQGDRMVGIISERDVLRTLASSTEPLERIRVEARMTRDVLSGAADDSVNKVMGIMTSNRIRHLPVLEHGRLIGLISIGDIVKAQYEQLEMENQMLMTYIQS